ncbi:MAG: hypothetical protein ACREBU_23685, partial [Nitrososphaera sp.]
MEKNSQITQIPIQDGSDRIETGAIQFNDDWPGLFIRGDDAFALILELKQLLKTLEEQDNQECLTNVVRRIVSIIEQDVI